MREDPKAIILDHAQVGTVSSRPDASVSLKIITAELRPSEAGILMGFHGKNAKVAIFPHEGECETVEVKTERDQKTQAQRIRGVIYKLWQQEGSQVAFEPYYQNRTEKIIEHLKKQLDS